MKTTKYEYTLEEARLMSKSARRNKRRAGHVVPHLPAGPRPGLKQSREWIRKRIKKGEGHYRWQGDKIGKIGGRTRALRMHRSIGPCRKCGNPKAERHHKDHNPANNAPDNIEALCRKCHLAEHNPVTFIGITLTASDWDRRMGYRVGLVAERLRDGWSVGRAISQKPRFQKRQDVPEETMPMPYKD